MTPHVPHGIVIAVAAVAALVPVAAILSAGLGARAARLPDWIRLGLGALLVYLCWGGIVVGLAALEIGWGKPYRWTAVVEAGVFVALPILGFAAYRALPRMRVALSHRSGLWRLASVQVARSLGLVFLILHAQRTLPGLFAYPAAWGDVAIAVTAPPAMWAVWFREDEIRRRGSTWQNAFIAWNILGLADHIAAVTLGTLHFPGVTHAIGSVPNTGMFSRLPMLLFPLFMVPFADTLHLVMIDAVRRPVGSFSRAGPGRDSESQTAQPSEALGAA